MPKAPPALPPGTVLCKDQEAGRENYERPHASCLVFELLPSGTATELYAHNNQKHYQLFSPHHCHQFPKPLISWVLPTWPRIASCTVVNSTSPLLSYSSSALLTPKTPVSVYKLVLYTAVVYSIYIVKYGET